MTLKDLILKYDFDTMPLHSSQQKIEEKSDDTGSWVKVCV